MSLRARKSSRPHQRKWRRRALLAFAALLAAAAATPFIFTAPLLRLYLAHSPYRDIPLRFRAAALRPTGWLTCGLTLRDVAIEDTRESAGKPLFTASRVQISLALNELSSNRLRTIALDNLDVTLRPGDDTPLTLLRLLPPEAQFSSSTAPPPPTQPPCGSINSPLPAKSTSKVTLPGCRWPGFHPPTHFPCRPSSAPRVQSPVPSATFPSLSARPIPPPGHLSPPALP